MKKAIVLGLALTVVMAAGANDRKTRRNQKNVVEVVPVVVLSNAIDSMSYSLGVNIGEDLLNNLSTLPGGVYNKELFLKAFSDAMKGNPVVITNQEAQAFLQEFFTSAQEAEASSKKSVGEKFLVDNKKNPAVQVTPSGLQYIVITEGDGAKPVSTDKVKVHYEGTLIDGTKFDSSYDRGEPIEFPLNQVIRGWTEGVQLMSVGSKYKFFIPYELGYGEQGASGVIPPFATLIFTIELLDINAPAITDQIKSLELQ
jgi:FKBP-type peptidyl-prolyl cis-trans isomerase